MCTMYITILIGVVLAVLIAEHILVVACLLMLSCVLLSVGLKAWVYHAFPRSNKNCIGFFHPFSDAGGGGERVLWVAIAALQKSRPDVEIAIFTGGQTDPKALAEIAMHQFHLRIAPTFKVIPLRGREALLPKAYPRFTLVRQATAAVRIAWVGLRAFVPGVWVDTTGWASTYPLARLAGCGVAAYVHYPALSSSMLRRVAAREVAFNNDAVASSSAGSYAKLVYYQALLVIYALCGLCAQVVMVNSSWTKRHVAATWHRRRPLELVYPPCNTEELQALPLNRKLKRVFIVSVAQFRPEKQHALQLRAFARARQLALTSDAYEAMAFAKLELVGGCRGPEDEARVAELKALARELGISEHVDFLVNLPYAQLHGLLGEAVAGLHTMRDEHFGIGVVELMAAGVVPIAHDSGGPREDIVVPVCVAGRQSPERTGFRCTTEEEFARAIVDVLSMSQVDRLAIAAAARTQAANFSDARFSTSFLRAMQPLLGGGAQRD